jgi:hypothetical protein
MRSGVTTAIASKNEAGGFYGVIEQHAEPNQAWALAVAGITTSTGPCDQAIRDFLDSRYGRHFAAEVAMGLWAARPPARGRCGDRALDGPQDRCRDSRASSGSHRGCPTSPASCACKRRCSKEPPKRAHSIAPRRAPVRILGPPARLEALSHPAGLRPIAGSRW